MVFRVFYKQVFVKWVYVFFNCDIEVNIVVV